MYTQSVAQPDRPEPDPITERLHRWVHEPLPRLPEIEQALRRAVCARHFNFHTSGAIRGLISRVAPRKRLPDRDVLVEVVKKYVEHVGALRRERAKRKPNETEVSLAGKRLTREIESAFYRCAFRGSASPSSEEELCIRCGQPSKP